MDYKQMIETSLKFIEENLSEELTLETLAEQTFLSKFHYHRVFHKFVGETVMSYIRKRRLTEAARELSEDNIRIVDIALKYQFGSQESFSRAFKRMFHISPNELKRANVNIIQYKKADLRNVDNTVQWMRNSVHRAA